MNYNQTTIIRGVIVGIACIVALLVGSTLTTDSFIPMAFAGAVGLLMLTAAVPQWLVVLCVAFSLLPGRTGLSVGYWEIFASALVARWVLTVPFTGNVFGRIQGKLTFVCIAGFTLILLMHGLPALLGMAISGRRPAVMGIAALGLSYLLLSGKLDLSKMTFLPWAGLLVGIICASFDLIGLAMPSAVPILYMIYGDQNWEILADYRGAQIDMIRLSGLRELGLGLAFLALTYFAFQRRFQLKQLIFQTSLTALGALFAIVAGYRSHVMQIMLGALLASYCRSKQTLILAVLCGTALMSSLVLYNDMVSPLPLPMQRALSWLPGDWDWQTKDDAENGFVWRKEIRNYYYTRIFPDSWLLGRGLVLEEKLPSMQWMAADASYNVEYFVALQLYHSGFVSALDYVGVVGTTLFIIASLRAVWLAIIVIRRREHSQRWHFWIATMYLTSLVPYWYTGFFDRSFPFFVVSMCLLEIAVRQPKDFADAESSGEEDYELEGESRA